MFPKSNVSVHVHYENVFRTIEGSQLSDWRERKKNEQREAFNGNSGIQHQWQFKYSAQQQQHSPHIANTLNNQNKWVEKQIFILTQSLFRSFILQFVLRNHTHTSKEYASMFFLHVSPSSSSLTFISSFACYEMLLFTFICCCCCCFVSSVFFFLCILSRHLDFNAFLLGTHDE